MRRLADVVDDLLAREGLPERIECLEAVGPLQDGDGLTWDDRLMCYRIGEICVSAERVRRDYQKKFGPRTTVRRVSVTSRHVDGFADREVRR